MIEPPAIVLLALFILPLLLFSLLEGAKTTLKRTPTNSLNTHLKPRTLKSLYIYKYIGELSKYEMVCIFSSMDLFELIFLDFTDTDTTQVFLYFQTVFHKV